MAKYINMDDLLEDIEHSVVFTLRPDKPSSINAELRGANKIIDRIRCAPAADVVEVRHGRWLPDYDYAEYDFDGSTPLSEPRKFQDGWQCSLCGQYEPSETNYCPNCGAKMEV